VIALLCCYGVLGLLLIVGGGRLGRAAFLVGGAAPLATLVWFLAQRDDVLAGRVITESATWVGELHLAVDLRLDGFAATMTLVVAGVGVLVFGYAAAYFDAGTADLGRLAGLLVLFAGAMIGLVQADNVFILYTFWELTSITSFLLIGIRHTDPKARAAAVHALLVTNLGGLAMLAGFVLLGTETGHYRLSELAASAPPSGTAITVAVILVLLGAFTKSAQYPFHAWLPGAMAAPTPVSAYLHAATMVTAGVYLVVRLAPAFQSVDVWRPLVFGVGTLTIIVGGIQALRQRDLKLMLAHGTVSQLGFMMVLVGAGTGATALAGWLLLVAHALFKAALFMVVGMLDRLTGTREIGRLPALDRSWWPIDVITIVSAASMAGVPLTAGFIAKEADFDAFVDARFDGHWLLLAVVVVGSVLTAAYATKFYWGAFVAPRRARSRADRREGGEQASPGPPAWWFAAPAAVLTVGTLVLGFVPSVEDSLATASVQGLRRVYPDVHLALWHGWNLELALSACALVGGVLLAAVDARRDAFRPSPAVPVAESVYFATLRGVTYASRRVTGVVQNGSLPVYAGVILATAAALPAWVLATQWEWPGWPEVVGAAADVPIAALLVVAALGAAAVRRRFAAAVFLGATGYAMAALFVAYGAPDLALTQVAVETLATVVFVLVLRRLPERFERQSTSRRRAVRLAIAGLVGATVFVFAIAASAEPSRAPVSQEMVDRALPDGEGANVVNVILVDFRGLDTMGEITVLAVAAIGAVALARVGRRAAEARGERPPVSRDESARRLVFVDVSVQVTFFAVILASLWLLFAGHNQPGGGFVGGLLAGSAITLRYIAGGIDEVRARSRFRPWTVLGAGVLLAAGTAMLPLLFGDSVLEVASEAFSVPALGTVKLSSALVFDIGVYLTVVGMVLMAFEAFGEEVRETAA
jgi:multicomponent Na+:H+ antiporter subunit A